MKNKDSLPDIQCTKSNLPISINQVGVENVEVPFLLESKNGGFHKLNANITLMTNLDSSTKGISMSRLLLTLKPYLDLPLKSILIKKILEDILENIDCSSALMRFEFKLPINKKSIKTDYEFPIYYKCKFEGQVYKIKKSYPSPPGSNIDCKFRFFQGVIVQYASYCPCSAELCKANGKGFAHNQRSFAHILTEIDIDKYYVWLEDIINAVEENIHTLVYPIIKRIDEQEIGLVASENPLFVEDAVRIISNSINKLAGISDWIVKCIHEESIHPSNAIAINWKQIPGGFDGRKYI